MRKNELAKKKRHNGTEEINLSLCCYWRFSAAIAATRGYCILFKEKKNYGSKIVERWRKRMNSTALCCRLVLPDTVTVTVRKRRG